MSQLKAIPRMSFKTISKRAEELYRTKADDMKMAMKVAANIAPKNVMSFVPQSGQQAMTKELGFKMPSESAQR